jgi:hypothetical protein
MGKKRRRRPVVRTGMPSSRTGKLLGFYPGTPFHSLASSINPAAGFNGLCRPSNKQTKQTGKTKQQGKQGKQGEHLENEREQANRFRDILNGSEMCVSSMLQKMSGQSLTTSFIFDR